MGHCLFFDTLDELHSYLGVAMLCCPSLLSSPSSDRMGSAKHRLIWDLLRSDVNSTRGLYCHSWKTQWKTASTSSGFTARWSGSSWTWPTHFTTYRCVRQFTCGKVGTRFLLITVSGMGGKSSPNTWGRFAATSGRQPSGKQGTGPPTDTSAHSGKNWVVAWGV